MSRNQEIKEHYQPFKLISKYNKESTELIFFFDTYRNSKINFNNFYLANHGKQITNYKSIHFIINGKELNEEKLKNFKLEIPFNEHQYNKDVFNMNNYIKVILNNSIDQSYNSPELYLSFKLETEKEIILLYKNIYRIYI